LVITSLWIQPRTNMMQGRKPIKAWGRKTEKGTSKSDQKSKVSGGSKRGGYNTAYALPDEKKSRRRGKGESLVFINNKQRRGAGKKSKSYSQS